jgi:lipoyl(octanoyl) transferase
MALDQTLLDLADETGQGFLRLYRWSPFCLSFGRHEPALRRYDRAEIERGGMDVVRRPTGGRAVWHARELTYAVAAPIAWFGTLPQSYRQIHGLLALAVRRLGGAASLAASAPTPSLGSGACFTSAAGGEVTIGGRKLVGSAQVRQGTAFLQHGSLLLEDNQEIVATLMRGPAPRGDEITFHEAVGRAISFEEAADSIVGAFRESPGEWRLEAPAIRARADSTHLRQFSDPAWTWRR